MSLQHLNEDWQAEQAARRTQEKGAKTMTNPISGMFDKLRGNKTGSLRGEYPDTKRLEEILCCLD